MSSSGGYRTSDVAYSIVTTVGPLRHVSEDQINAESVEGLWRRLQSGELPEHLPGHLLKSELLETRRVDGHTSEDSGSLYVHLARGDIDLTEWHLSQSVLEGSHRSTAVRQRTIFAPLSVTFRFEPDLATSRPMVSDEFPWLAQILGHGSESAKKNNRDGDFRSPQRTRYFDGQRERRLAKRVPRSM